MRIANSPTKLNTAKDHGLNSYIRQSNDVKNNWKSIVDKTSELNTDNLHDQNSYNNANDGNTEWESQTHDQPNWTPPKINLTT